MIDRSRWPHVLTMVALLASIPVGAAGLDVPIVAFGHSHRPERRPLRNGGRYYNLGTWAPVLDPGPDPALVRARRFLLVRPSGGGRLYVAFERWGEDDTRPF